ncbi:DUF3368 domain-containing protein [Saprospiraceae bacterium]|nr:DUF3368 domain-containing protein [Saprospiraceae bacterium]
MLIVCDTSPITNLLQIGQLDILHLLFKQIVIPQSVYKELVNYEDQKKEIHKRSWIIVKAVLDIRKLEPLELYLDKGEAEAIILAKELSADIIVIDERRGRKVATDYGLKIIGLLGILISAKRKGHIDLLKPYLHKLVFDIGFRINDSLYQRVLQEVDEAE